MDEISSSCGDTPNPSSNSQLDGSTSDKIPPPRPQKPPRPRFPPPPYVPPPSTTSSQPSSTTTTIPQIVQSKSAETSDKPLPPPLPPPPSLSSLPSETKIISPGASENVSSPEGNDSVFEENPQERTNRVQQMKTQLIKMQLENKAPKLDKVPPAKSSSTSEVDVPKTGALTVERRGMSQGKLTRPISSQLEAALARPPPVMGFRLPGLASIPLKESDEVPEQSNQSEKDDRKNVSGDERVISFDTPPDKNFLSSVGMERTKLKPNRNRAAKKVTVAKEDQNFQFGCEFFEKTEIQEDSKPPEVETSISEENVESHSKEETKNSDDFELLD